MALATFDDVTSWLGSRISTRTSWPRRIGVALVLVLLVLWAQADYPTARLSYAPVQSTRIFDRHGALLYERRGEIGGYGQPVALDEIAEPLLLATLSSEDANFRYHPGIDPVAVLRALWLDLSVRRWAYGGSTITQQLAKRLDPQPRSLRGKLREALDAVRLERTLSKDEILTQYLNRAYYGRLAYGVEAAAQRYFGKRASELELDEAALLAILPRAPTAYDPVRHPERARERRSHVLQVMAERGWITEAQARRAADKDIVLIDPAQERRAPHALDYAHNRRLIPTGTAEARLTIDVELQERLEQRLRMHLAEVQQRAASQAGIVVLDNATGEVLAMVGSRRYGEAEVDGAVNVTTSVRPPGSTLKPFVYALAIERGASPSTLVLDVPTHWRGYQPRALRLSHHGAVPMRDALGSSLNVPAVRTAARLGVEPVAQLLHDVGLHSVDAQGGYGLSLALGGASVPLLELANGYATLARGGRYLPVRLLQGAPREPARQVITEQTAFLVTDMLADASARRREFGFETPLELPFAVAAKTGTSQAFGDNVAVGYTPAVTVAVWVGNFDGASMHGLLAMQGAAPLWRDAMQLAMADRAQREFEPPVGIVRADICADSGLLADDTCRRRRPEVLAARHVPASHRGSGAWPTDESRESVPAPPHLARVDGGPVEILGPPDAAVFVIDPLLSRRRQRVELRAAVRAAGVEAVRWLVDGEPVAEVGPPFAAHWTLSPGRHRLRAELVGGDGPAGAAGLASDEIDFEVEGEET